MSEPVAVILAAGEGKRMGVPKALLEHEKGRTFLDQLQSTFTKAGCRVITVVGKHAEDIRAHHPGANLVENPDWERGQFSSIKAGLKSALSNGANLILVHPVDMPMIRASTVSSLLMAIGEADGAVPEFEGAPGHPLALTRAAADKVLGMTDVEHMEAAQKRLVLRRMKTKDPAVMVNLNTPEVYERILGTAPHLAPARKRRMAKHTEE
jgi:molybdenum cofactor cytidylyltransferase